MNPMATNPLFQITNLHAWCIVPYDGRERGPVERMQMLQRLGMIRYVYDWREKHIPTFDQEVEASLASGVEMSGWWFSKELNDTGKKILEVIDRHGIQPELWVTSLSTPLEAPEGAEHAIQSSLDKLFPIIEAAAERNLRVALYNHGGWFGEPENQVELIERIQTRGFNNVGIAYNLHHGHSHLDRMEALIALMKPHLLAFNLNGMKEEGDKHGKKLLPLSQGDRELDILAMLVRSGWSGPVGILNHTDEDAELRLRDNLEGLAWLVSKLEGNDPGPVPTPKSWNPEPVS
jgi:hypothetical protein